MLKEIRVHGRGGQGAVTSSQILAIAAFLDGKQSQAFPNFGVERQGAPVQSFARISDKFINVRQQVYEPDYVIVLDASLVAALDVSAGLKDGGVLIINSDKSAEELLGAKRVKELKGKKVKVKAINITKTALDIIGKPFVNVAALGAFAGATKEVSLGSLKKAIDEQLGAKGNIAGLNKEACEKLYREAEASG